MFFTECIRACFCFVLIGGNLTAQKKGATGELEVQFKFQRCSCKLSFLFLPHRQSPGELALREMSGCLLRLHPEQQLVRTTYPQFTCAIVALPFISSATSTRTSNFFKASRSEINIV